jgi:hypothetical protein
MIPVDSIEHDAIVYHTHHSNLLLEPCFSTIAKGCCWDEDAKGSALLEEYYYYYDDEAAVPWMTLQHPKSAPIHLQWIYWHQLNVSQ